MAGQTPNMSFPFPHDTDQIDVAGDIEKLAQAVDYICQVLAEKNEAQDQYDYYQNDVIATVTDFARAVNQKADDLDVRVDAIEAGGGGGGGGGRRVYGDRALYTTNAEGYVEVRWPVGTFGQNSSETSVTIANVGNPGVGDRGWQMSAIWGTSWEGFGCTFSANGVSMNNQQVWVHYIAAGVAP